MMKTAIIYYTKTGHSRKIANAISKELHISAEDIKTNPDLREIDLLFIVGGIYGGQSNPEMINYIKKIDSSMVKKAAIITSSAGKKAKQEKARELLIENKVEVIFDEFICQGSFLFVGMGHPNKDDMENAVAYAKKTLNETIKSLT